MASPLSATVRWADTATVAPRRGPTCRQLDRLDPRVRTTLIRVDWRRLDFRRSTVGAVDRTRRCGRLEYHPLQGGRLAPQDCRVPAPASEWLIPIYLFKKVHQSTPNVCNPDHLVHGATSLPRGRRSRRQHDRGPDRRLASGVADSLRRKRTVWAGGASRVPIPQ